MRNSTAGTCREIASSGASGHGHAPGLRGGKHTALRVLHPTDDAKAIRLRALWDGHHPRLREPAQVLARQLLAAAPRRLQQATHQLAGNRRARFASRHLLDQGQPGAPAALPHRRWWHRLQTHRSPEVLVQRGALCQSQAHSRRGLNPGLSLRCASRLRLAERLQPGDRVARGSSGQGRFFTLAAGHDPVQHHRPLWRHRRAGVAPAGLAIGIDETLDQRCRPGDAFTGAMALSPGRRAETQGQADPGARLDERPAAPEQPVLSYGLRGLRGAACDGLG